MIRAQNITKVFKSKNGIKKALDSVNLTINEQEILALLGVNGAGKTTLSSIIASLNPPSQGQVLFRDQTISKNLFEYRKAIGFCPQKQNLDTDLTLEQNLIFQGRYYGMKKDHIQTNIDQLLHTFELGEYKKMQSSVLSGGYKQRFLIARALIHEPKLVILDEPTVGLDPQVRHKLWDMLKSLKNTGTSILLTTHYLDEAEYLADRVCVIDHGKIKLVDSPSNLKRDLQGKNLEEVFLKLLEVKNA